MPAEKFYPPTATEGRPSDHIEIGWHRDYDGIHITTVIPRDGDAPILTALPLDRSAINRLIRTLRRARDATYGRDQ